MLHYMQSLVREDGMHARKGLELLPLLSTKQLNLLFYIKSEV